MGRGDNAFPAAGRAVLIGVGDSRRSASVLSARHLGPSAVTVASRAGNCSLYVRGDPTAGSDTDLTACSRRWGPAYDAHIKALAQLRVTEDRLDTGGVCLLSAPAATTSRTVHQPGVTIDSVRWPSLRRARCGNAGLG
jgi:hypothetical protein